MSVIYLFSFSFFEDKVFFSFMMIKGKKRREGGIRTALYFFASLLYQIWNVFHIFWEMFINYEKGFDFLFFELETFNKKTIKIYI